MRAFALPIAAAGFAVAGCGGSDPRTGEDERTVRGFGLTVALQQGWNGRVYRLSPQHAITLQAATVPLGPPGADEAAIARVMQAKHAYLVIDDIGPPPAGLGRDPAWVLDPALPLTIHESDVHGPWKGGFASGASLGVVLENRALMIRVRFGSHPRRERHRGGQRPSRNAHGRACVGAGHARPLTAFTNWRRGGMNPARERRYHRLAMAERAAVERELEEIGTQLAWVRDYL